MIATVYAGYDPREAVGYHGFVQSLVETSTKYALTHLCGKQADGTNAFTYSRFSIPEREYWGGWAIFVDGSDMLLRAPIEELWDLRDSKYAVQVVKHDYKTAHPRKYLGTEMESPNEDYPRKNWSSVMLINCGHRAHFKAREKMREQDGQFLHRFGWLRDEEIGELPKEWNWLCDEYGPNPEAKLLHWTTGIPGFYQYRHTPHAQEWWDTVSRSRRGM